MFVDLRMIIYKILIKLEQDKSDKNFKMFLWGLVLSCLIVVCTLLLILCNLYYFSNMKYQFIIFFVLLEVFFTGLIYIMLQNIKYLLYLEEKKIKRIPEMIKIIKKKFYETSFGENYKIIWDELCQDLNKKHLTDSTD